MTKWQPIATAPKDHTTVLVCQKVGGRWLYSAMEWDDMFNHWRTEACGGFEYEEDITEPTHWKPLEPPE